MSDAGGRCVLDASAVLAYLQDERGHEYVAQRLDRGFISAVNLAEVATKLLEKGGSVGEITLLAQLLGLEVVPFEEELAYQAALLRGPTKPLGLSLADRICLATAQYLGVPVITTDSAWASLKIGIRVEIARPPSAN